jgi:hypothetical protein
VAALVITSVCDGLLGNNCISQRRRSDLFCAPDADSLATNPEPVPPQIIIEGMPRGQILDLGRLIIPWKENVPSGQLAPMNVAARFGDEPDCYGFSNESYPTVSGIAQWGHPPEWRLGPERISST